MRSSAVNRYDFIVIGAGHNGLTTAAFLAKKGHKVLVLERRKVIGGMAAGEAFYPGYRTSGLLHDSGQIQEHVIRKLALESHGLKVFPERPSVLALAKKGSALLLSGNSRKTYKEIKRLSAKDADQYLSYRYFIKRIQGFIKSILEDLPPEIESLNVFSIWEIMKKGIALRRLGKKDMMELIRIAPMCIADWLNEFFETDGLKAALAGPALEGNFAGPRSPGTAINLLMWECTARNTVRGGPQALVSALERVAKKNGAELRTEAEVAKIEIAGDRVKGVVLQDGECIQALNVAASCDPRNTFLNLIKNTNTESRHIRRIQNVRGSGITAKVHLAMNSTLEFSCRPGEAIEFARVAIELDHLERAFDEAKYGSFSSEPILDIHVPTVSCPELAPKGHHVVSVLVHFIPYELREGWNNEKVEQLGDLVVYSLEQYAPGLSQAIVGREVLSPVDFEKRYGLFRGHIKHGDHALDQLILRPTQECAQYSTPIKGLYLCGSGSHPGGGITCGPGSLAAYSIAQTQRA